MVTAAVGLGCVLIILFRAPLATFLVREYLAGRGVRSDVVVDSINFRDVIAHGSLGREREVAFGRIVAKFNSKSWLPEISAIDIEHAVVHVTVGANGLSFGSLQPFLAVQSEQAAAMTALPRFVSPHLAIDISGARILAATPVGPVEIDANAGMVAGQPQWIDAVIRPARLHFGSLVAEIAGGTLKSTAAASGLRMTLSLSGNAILMSSAGPVHIGSTRLLLDIPALHWQAMKAWAPSAMLSVAAKVYRQGVPPTPWQFGTHFSNVSAGIFKGQFRSIGRVTITAVGSLSPADARALIAATPLVGSDRHMARALLAASGDLALNLQFSWRAAGQAMAFMFDTPVQLGGVGPTALRLVPGRAGLRLTPSGASGGIDVALRGRDMPNITFAIPKFSWRNAGNRFGGAFGVEARFDYGAFHGMSIDAQGKARLANGVFRVDLARCAALHIASLTSHGKSTLLDAAATLCAKGGQPLFAATRTGWTFRGTAKEVRASVGATGLQLAGDGDVRLDGSAIGLGSGLVDVAAVVSDRSKAPRLAPMSVAGQIGLANTGARGRFAVTTHRQRIGTVTFVQHMKTGAGQATFDFANMAFDPQGLQPVDLSPLLAPMAQAKGKAGFTGHIEWTAKHIASSGRLDISDLQFSSPLGTAEQLRTHLVLTSLLPPATAPGQQIAISRVNWMVPLTKIETLASLAASQLRIDAASTDLAGGAIALSPLVIDLKTGKAISGTLRLSHVGLGELLAASNLGGEVRLAGRMSGAIPFTFGPSGLHFADGHISADGPGRLAIEASLWGPGEHNAVEKFAYRALQNLAYNALSATVESEPHGRLRVVFHIKGYNDSPGEETAEINLFDLLHGTAFQKNIPLPRGTPIDLTLDTSLNFDELLRGYETAWSATEAQ
ncbi:MAG: YdbH domain-containing protein [Alphaproteobacteria bacterium]|nr:YdbH domain-containing protein [Alphaproteobacteria bacterium]